MFKFAMLFLLLFPVTINSQPWTHITDQSNPVVKSNYPRGYNGTAWVDIDRDGDLDLFVANEYLFKNTGSGTFEEIFSLKGKTSPVSQSGTAIASGASWADYDNDGDPDLLYTGGKSFLFRNEGDFQFTKVTEGAVGDSSGNRAWAGSFADYDLDGNIDILMTHPAGFIPGDILPNLLFKNSGPPDYTFTKVTGFEFLSQTAPYTVATWSDFDLDGDPDLFIGSGPAGKAARDFLYRNRVKEIGIPGFERISDLPIGTDAQDGQVWNLIDIDNDRDLDAYITNYSGSPSRLYRNTNGAFVSESTPLNLRNNATLANSWADFDLDGDLDVVITSEANNFMFLNDGNGVFTSTTNSITEGAVGRGITIGDYDNDGDPDIFISGLQTSLGLFRNDLPAGNSWLRIIPDGSVSNRSGIGVKVHAHAIINGSPTWQLREISSQNSFNSMNSPEAHFGFGSAQNIDTLVVEWPSGIKDSFFNTPVNQVVIVSEGTTVSVNHEFIANPETIAIQAYPNPSNPIATIRYTIPKSGLTRIVVFDTLGRPIQTLMNKYLEAGSHQLKFSGENLVSGSYFIRVESGEINKTIRLVFIK